MKTADLRLPLRYGYVVKRFASLFLLLVPLGFSGAVAQRVPLVRMPPPTPDRGNPGFREWTDGNERICRYPSSSSSILSRDEQVTFHRVGIAENCPESPPPAIADLDAPPTAPLQSDQAAGPSRVCIYEVRGTAWRYDIPSERPCPVAAGMLDPTVAHRVLSTEPR